MNIWPAIGFGIVLIFNVGMFVAFMKNHAKHTEKAFEKVDEKLDQLFSKTNANSTAIAKMEGKLNNRK